MDFLLLMGYTLFLISIFSCQPVFLTLFLPCPYLSLSHNLSLILAGIIAGSVRTLPHVKKYQTVIPQKLKDSSLSNDAATHQVTHTLPFLSHH